MNAPVAAYLLPQDNFPMIYSPGVQSNIAELLDGTPPLLSSEQLLSDPQLGSDIEILFGGWGTPCLDEELLEVLPRLQAVFYGAGTVRYLVSDAFWSRNLLLTSSWMANAIPVAEFTMAQIILSLKKAWPQAMALRTHKTWSKAACLPGAYTGARVGLVSLGAIGRMVAERLQQMDLAVLAFDPFVSEEEMHQLGVEKADLPALFAQCDVVSLHAPDLPQTRNMITEDLLRSMKEGATFINTARGAVVDEAALIRVLEDRPDLVACLDVTHPEPPVDGSPLYSLPNVMLTPHIAGSAGFECHRMGEYVVEELRRYLSGEPPRWPVTQELFQRMA